MSEQREPLNLYFRLVVASVALFVVTIFAMVATMFSDANAPLNQFLNEFGGILIGVEVVVTLVLGLTAMTVDRRRTLRLMQEAATVTLSEERESEQISGPSRNSPSTDRNGSSTDRNGPSTES